MARFIAAPVTANPTAAFELTGGMLTSPNVGESFARFMDPPLPTKMFASRTRITNSVPASVEPVSAGD